MIVAFTGALGAGKTLGAVRFCWEHSLRAGGVSVYSNLHLNPGYFEPHKRRAAQLGRRFKLSHLADTGDLVEMVRGGGGILLLDEMHMLLDSRLSMQYQNIYLSEFAMFFRKLGITVVFTTQYERQLDLRLRHVIELMVRCRKEQTPAGRIFRQDYHDWQAGRFIKTKQWPEEDARSWYGAYDTYQLVKGFKFPGQQKRFQEFLERIEQAAQEARGKRSKAKGDGERDEAAGRVELSDAPAV